MDVEHLNIKFKSTSDCGLLQCKLNQYSLPTHLPEAFFITSLHYSAILICTDLIKLAHMLLVYSTISYQPIK